MITISVAIFGSLPYFVPTLVSLPPAECVRVPAFLAVLAAVLQPGFFRSRAALQMSKKSHHWQALLAAELLQLSSLFWHIPLQRSGRFDQSRQDRIFKLKC